MARAPSAKACPRPVGRPPGGGQGSSAQTTPDTRKGPRENHNAAKCVRTWLICGEEILTPLLAAWRLAEITRMSWPDSAKPTLRHIRLNSADFALSGHGC